MFAAGPLLVLMGLMGGGGDIVSSIPAKEYFAVRQIEPTVDKLLELAATPPATPKEQIAQLFALRQLALDAATLKTSAKAADVRKLLREIADGKKANDAAGFAAQYAGHALVAIDGGKEKPLRRGSWREGMAWLPKEVTFLGGFDSKDAKPGDLLTLDTTTILQKIPKQDKEVLFDSIEKIGNVRIERVVFGIQPAGDKQLEFDVRLTGKFNPKWLLSVLPADAKVSERTISGRKVAIVEKDGEAIAAILDDSDVLIAGATGQRSIKVGPDGKQQVIEEDQGKAVGLKKMLSLVSSPGDDATKGSLKDDLAKVPATASALLVGPLPAQMAKGVPFAMPEKILAHATRSAAGLDVRVKATMKGENDVGQFVKTIADGRDSALKQLAQLNGQPLPGVNLNSLTSLLESIQLQSEGNTVQLQMLVPVDAATSLPAMFLMGVR